MAKKNRRQKKEQSDYKATKPDQLIEIDGTDLEVALWISEDRKRDARCHLAISRNNGKRACRTLLPEHLFELVDLVYQMANVFSEDEDIPLSDDERESFEELAAELEEVVDFDKDEDVADAA